MTTTLWIAVGAIVAALIARQMKVSEFRQSWIDGLRADISKYVTEANKWIDEYLEFNAELDQEIKHELAPSLESKKYSALHVLRRIELRFKPDDSEANALIEDLRNLLNPGKLRPNNEAASWAKLSDLAILQARILLKEEWEVTKNPFRHAWKKFVSRWGSSSWALHGQERLKERWKATKQTFQRLWNNLSGR
ncbi:hypothetical protein Thimo_2250 [Thioflavicoccus mobilis 8321]|uniref:Uncharacterized protein n=1 Tax=Thioflavicoccus mobilis 8321 TaxID=765912 RepID=L0GYI3_9GAMM|nr:hypothetical protein [Thioflavicoccus mobilis]AGA90996.1 hypothetical protein Thimo_2250 [Thioflavicoccus mobilis 8321]